MMRPPLISTDISDLPPSVRLLLSALCQLDLRFLPLLAVDVDALLLEGVDRLLCQVGAIGGPCRGLLDDLELVRDVRGLFEGCRVHDADPELVRPDECVDLVQLPRLVP